MARPKKELTGLSRAPSMVPKAQQSKTVGEQVAEFIARGGCVKQIVTGETGIKVERHKSAQRGNQASVKSRKGGARYREQSYQERIARGLDTAPATRGYSEPIDDSAGADVGGPRQ